MDVNPETLTLGAPDELFQSQRFWINIHQVLPKSAFLD
jgi:hypothetical protein